MLTTPRRSTWMVAALLAAGTALLHARVAVHPFIYFDDTRYLTENPVVQRGITWRGLGWALTTLHASNWHPLTWLSHMLDVELFGMNPGAHHLVNVAFHAANAALLFLVLLRMTGARGRSAFVAVLFAIHPLHVESVAWVSERKDVLSTFLGLLALAAYQRYAKRPSLRRYALVPLAFAASLLAKPMWVTFPFLLLLLDAWPLRRLEGLAFAQEDGPAAPAVPLRRLLLEKAPLLALSTASSVVTVIAQDRGRALTGLELGLGPRLGNAAVSYVRYLGKTLWPTDLAVYYPHPAGDLPPVRVLLSGALLAALTAVAVRQAKRLPWLTVGWLWFVGTLIPVIGLVQVGGQAMADRYTYLPIVGLFVSLAWGGHRLAQAWPTPVPLRVAASGAALVLCALTWRQEGYWSSHEALFRHALAAGGESGIAHAALSEGLRHDGKIAEALLHAQEAVRISPYTAKHWNNLAMMHLEQGEPLRAQYELQEALRLEPSYDLAWSNLGQVALDLGLLDDAAYALQQATTLAPEDGKAWNRLGQLRVQEGDLQRALQAYREAVRVQPDYAAAWTNLAVLCQGTGLVAEAGDAFAAVARVQPENPVAWRNLGVFLARNGRSHEAAEAFQRALQLKPGDSELLQRLANARR